MTTTQPSPAQNTKLNMRYRVVDGDGHLLDHPTALWERAPAKYKDRMWRVIADETGREWVHFDGGRRPANRMAFTGSAGMTPEMREQANRGELEYSLAVPASFNPAPRLRFLEDEGIDQTVLFPSTLPSIAAVPDHAFAAAVCRAYNEWAADYCRYSPTRLFAVALAPNQNIALAVQEIRHARKLGLVGVYVRPNPTVDGKKLDDPIYDPLWRACVELDMAVAMHPHGIPDLPGASRDLGFAVRNADANLIPVGTLGLGHINNLFFAVGLSNPVDMMSTFTYLVGGGVFERFPTLRVVILETNGGWIVPWLERLNHLFATYRFDVPDMKIPASEYFRRQCWISFDPDETTLAFTAGHPLVGADRIIWASDYPHPEAIYPGLANELAEATHELSESQRARILGLNAVALYRLPEPEKPA